MPEAKPAFEPSILKIMADRERLITCAKMVLDRIPEPLTLEETEKLNEAYCWATMGWAE